MQDFLVALLIAFLLFGVLRRIFFNSAYAAFTKHKREEDERWKEEMNRKKEGRISVQKLPSNKNDDQDAEYTDYEEIS